MNFVNGFVGGLNSRALGEMTAYLCVAVALTIAFGIAVHKFIERCGIK